MQLKNNPAQGSLKNSQISAKNSPVPLKPSTPLKPIATPLKPHTPLKPPTPSKQMPIQSKVVIDCEKNQINGPAKTVESFLKELNLLKFISNFMNNGIDNIEKLSYVNNEHLKMINIPYASRLKILKKIKHKRVLKIIGEETAKIYSKNAFKVSEDVDLTLAQRDKILYDTGVKFTKEYFIKYCQFVFELFEIYDTMQNSGIKPSSITCGTLIKAYSQQKDLNSVLKLYEFMKAEEIPLSSVTYGSLINACITNDNLPKALEFYEEFKSNGYEMNTILYTTLIKAYNKTKNLSKVLETFNEMKKSEETKPNRITYNSVIDCCLKCLKYDIADSIFNEMLNNNDAKPDIITFSTMIKGYFKANNFAKAMELFDMMMEQNVKGDDVLLNTLLDGCLKVKQYQKAKSIFDTLTKNGVKPKIMSYSVMMKILGLMNDFQASKILLNEEGANATWDLASLASKNDKKQFDISFIHNKGNTKADMNNYGVALNASRLVFSGTNHIQKKAKKSNTNQNAKIIVFDKDASGKANPILRIDENDVLASHAAIVGRLNDEHLFYLKSRGLNEEEAKALIVSGYLKPIAKNFDSNTQNKINKMIMEKCHV